MSALLIGCLTTTKDGTVTVAIPEHNIIVHLPWTEAASASVALMQSAGTASAIAGVSRDDFAAAMLAAMGEVTP